MSLEAFRGFRNLIPYHSIYRSLYYAPIAVAAVRYGQWGGALTAVATSALYLPMCDSTGQRLHQLLPKAQVKLLDQASHFTMLDLPEVFYRALLAWQANVNTLSTDEPEATKPIRFHAPAAHLPESFS